jgi:hypothetical protein
VFSRKKPGQIKVWQMPELAIMGPPPLARVCVCAHDLAVLLIWVWKVNVGRVKFLRSWSHGVMGTLHLAGCNCTSRYINLNETMIDRSISGQN